MRIGIALLTLAQFSATGQGRVEYVGGTVAKFSDGAKGTIDLTDDHYLAIYSGKSQMRIPYGKINLLEYGQQVNRRLALAIIISPILLLSKSRKHFLSIGYAGENGEQQALVFRVDKDGIRATLVGLEARTGQKIQYQDQDARKAGK